MMSAITMKLLDYNGLNSEFIVLNHFRMNSLKLHVEILGQSDQC